MMTGQLYIDGLDAYISFGAYVTEGGFNDLATFPPLKTPPSNDWQEEDGIEVDLSAPRLDTREVTMKFAFAEPNARLLDFIELLSDSAYHDFNCRAIGRSFKLRLTQGGSLDIVGGIRVATFKFADDFPMPASKVQPPQSDYPTYEEYLLDGRPLTDYGCHVLEGSLAEVLKASSVKQNLLRDIPSMQGAIYDGDGGARFKAKEAKIKCLMRASSLQQLWRNWDALLRQLASPGERELRVGLGLNRSFPCRYKSASVSAFYPDGKIWLEFALTLVFTRDFAPSSAWGLLAAQSGDCIAAEDGSLILLRPLSQY